MDNNNTVKYSPCPKHNFHKCIARVLAYREALPMTFFYMELVLTTFAAVHPVLIFGYSCFSMYAVKIMLFLKESRLMQIVVV